MIVGWNEEELKLFDSSDELHLSSSRADGRLSSPTTMWMVRRGQDVFVRSVNGRASQWFRRTQEAKQGRIQVGHLEQDVQFKEVDAAIADELDELYRRKYGRYAQSIVDRITSDYAREAALELEVRRSVDGRSGSGVMQ